MAATLNGNGIVFGDGSNQITDATQIITKEIFLPRSHQSPSSTNGYGLHVWHFAAAPINVRGRRYCSVYNVYMAGGGKSSYWTWVANGNAEITVQNVANRTLRINLIHGVYDATDDASSWIVYRDGTVSNSYTHSGGSVVYDSGSAGRTGGYGSPSLNTVTSTVDIAASTTAKFTIYAGVMGGSNADALGAYLQATFNSWL